MRILVREEHGYRYWVWEPSHVSKDFKSLQAFFYERVKGDAGVMYPPHIDPKGSWEWVQWDGKQWLDAAGKPHHPTKHVTCHVHITDSCYLERK